MPESNNECVADARYYSMGDKIVVTHDVEGKLSETEFAVVGGIESVLYISQDYGSTTVGDGKLSSFAFVKKETFILPVYTEVYLTIAGSAGYAAYSDEDKELSAGFEIELAKIKVGNPAWHIFGREAAIGYSELEDDIGVIKSIARVFPSFYFDLGAYDVKHYGTYDFGRARRNGRFIIAGLYKCRHCRNLISSLRLLIWWIL